MQIRALILTLCFTQSTSLRKSTTDSSSSSPLQSSTSISPENIMNNSTKKLFDQKEACPNNVGIKTCNTSYTRKFSIIKDFCESHPGSLGRPFDLWLSNPVRNLAKVTYVNVFCAICNGEETNNLDFSNLKLDCTNPYTNQLEPVPKIIPDKRIFEKLQPFEDGNWFYAPSDDSKYVCSFRPSGYSESANYPQKNSNLSWSAINLKTGTLDGEWSIKVPRFSACHAIPNENDSGLYELVCSQRENEVEKCELSLRKCSFRGNADSLQKSCVWNASANISDGSFYKREDFRGYECIDRLLSPEIRYWCQTLSNFLGCVLVVTLCLHLVFFYWLPEKNILDKNTVALGFTFLVELLCVLWKAQKLHFAPDCRIKAVIWHYSSLSSFTWMLMLSVDCWLGLLKATKPYVIVNPNEDEGRFLTYIMVSFGLPLVITVVALGFGLVPHAPSCFVEDAYSNYECLIAELPGFTKFYLVPAGILFVCNICFLGHSIHLALLRQSQYYEEGATRHKFETHLGLAMMMSPTWMCASLMLLASLEIVDLAFNALLLLQSIFIVIFIFIQVLNRYIRSLDTLLHKLRRTKRLQAAAAQSNSCEGQRAPSLLGSSPDEMNPDQNIYI